MKNEFQEMLTLEYEDQIDVTYHIIPGRPRLSLRPEYIDHIDDGLNRHRHIDADVLYQYITEYTSEAGTDAITLRLMCDNEDGTNIDLSDVEFLFGVEDEDEFIFKPVSMTLVPDSPE